MFSYGQTIFIVSLTGWYDTYVASYKAHAGTVYCIPTKFPHPDPFILYSRL